MEEESWGRNQGGGIWEASGRHEEASGRHMGGIWDASGGIWETSEGDIWGVYGARGHPGAREAAWRQSVPKSLCFTVFEVATDRFACILEG